MNLGSDDGDDLFRPPIDDQHLVVRQRVRIGSKDRNLHANITRKGARIHGVRNHLADMQTGWNRRSGRQLAQMSPNLDLVSRRERERMRRRRCGGFFLRSRVSRRRLPRQQYGGATHAIAMTVRRNAGGPGKSFFITILALTRIGLSFAARSEEISERVLRSAPLLIALSFRFGLTFRRWRGGLGRFIGRRLLRRGRCVLMVVMPMMAPAPMPSPRRPEPKMRKPPMPMVMMAPGRMLHQVRRCCSAKFGERHCRGRACRKRACQDGRRHRGRDNGAAVALLAFASSGHSESSP